MTWHTSLSRVNAITAVGMSTCFAIIGVMSIITPLFMTAMPQQQLDAIHVKVNEVQLCVFSATRALFDSNGMNAIELWAPTTFTTSTINARSLHS